MRDFMAQLTMDALAGISLPARQFFVPTDEFMDFVARVFKDDLIIEAGCGQGDFLKAIHAKGIKAMGIDPCDREDIDTYNYILPADAGGYSYPAVCVVMMARPCHGEWIDRTIDNVLDAPGRSFYYIGLKRNLEGDLYGYDYELVYEGAGEEGENMYRVTLKE